MAHEQDTGEDCPVTEMAIVDTFTKLIFGQKHDYSSRELSIVEAFRLIETDVLRDSHLEMGEYLRNLGVREMIQLVTSLRDYMNENVESLSASDRQTARSAPFEQPR